MPRTEEGEYELVLGNRQLLSIIFIIMILFGVVFSLGYFMGRSAAPEPVAVTAARPPAAEPASPAPPVQGSEAPLEPGQVRVATGAPEAGAPAPAPTASPPQPVETKPATAPAPAETPAAAVEASPYPEPAPGQVFLQVAAVKRAEAEIIVDVLKRKGFAAVVAPGPSETLFRVLVGPLKDTDAVAKTRTDLEAVGFKSSYLRKY